MNLNRRLLLHGAIRKDVGNGLQFYKALDAASEEDLRWALATLEGSRYLMAYGFGKIRRKEITRKLLSDELE
jgi:hypothetical protein